MSLSGKYAVGICLSEPYQTLSPWFDDEAQARAELARLRATTKRLLSIAHIRTDEEIKGDAKEAADWDRHNITYHAVFYVRQSEHEGLVRARGPIFASKERAQQCADRLRGEVRTGTMFFDAVDAPGRLKLMGELQ